MLTTYCIRGCRCDGCGNVSDLALVSPRALAPTPASSHGPVDHQADMKRLGPMQAHIENVLGYPALGFEGNYQPRACEVQEVGPDPTQDETEQRR